MLPLISLFALSASVAASSNDLLRKRDDTCSCFSPAASSFANDDYVSSASNNAVTPSGYTNTGSNGQGWSEGDGCLGFADVDDYDSSICAKLCDNLKECSTFQIYFEKDSSDKPQVKCAFWGGVVDSSQVNWNVSNAIAGCNTYTSNNVVPPSGFGTPKWYGNSAFDYSSDSTASAAYIGSKSYSDGSYDVSRCADDMTALGGSFYNTYLLHSDDGSSAQHCDVYSSSIPSSAATWTGNKGGDGKYSISNSFACEKSGNKDSDDALSNEGGWFDWRSTATNRGPADTSATAGPTKGHHDGPDGPDGPSDSTTYTKPDGPNETKTDGPKGSDDTAHPTGPKDTAGPTGPKDTNGPTGPKDTTGPTGPKDTASPTGPKDTNIPTSPKDTNVPTGPKDTGVPTGPKDTTAPTGPKDTIIPTGPKDTTSPTGPMGTASPTNPKDTMSPTGPKDTTIPTGPMGTVSPTDPKNTMSPTGPMGTASPTGLTDTMSPTGPMGTVSPTGPTDTMSPTDPKDTMGPTGPKDTTMSTGPDGTMTKTVPTDLPTTFTKPTSSPTGSNPGRQPPVPNMMIQVNIGGSKNKRAVSYLALSGGKLVVVSDSSSATKFAVADGYLSDASSFVCLADSAAGVSEFIAVDSSQLDANVCTTWTQNGNSVSFSNTAISAGTASFYADASGSIVAPVADSAAPAGYSAVTPVVVPLSDDSTTTAATDAATTAVATSGTDPATMSSVIEDPVSGEPTTSPVADMSTSATSNKDDAPMDSTTTPAGSTPSSPAIGGDSSSMMTTATGPMDGQTTPVASSMSTTMPTESGVSSMPDGSPTSDGMTTGSTTATPAEETAGPTTSAETTSMPTSMTEAPGSTTVPEGTQDTTSMPTDTTEMTSKPTGDNPFTFSTPSESATDIPVTSMTPSEVMTSPTGDSSDKVTTPSSSMIPSDSMTAPTGDSSDTFTTPSGTMTSETMTTSTDDSSVTFTTPSGAMSPSESMTTTTPVFAESSPVADTSESMATTTPVVAESSPVADTSESMTNTTPVVAESSPVAATTETGTMETSEAPTTMTTAESDPTTVPATSVAPSFPTPSFYIQLQVDSAVLNKRDDGTSYVSVDSDASLKVVASVDEATQFAITEEGYLSDGAHYFCRADAGDYSSIKAFDTVDDAEMCATWTKADGALTYQSSTGSTGSFFSGSNAFLVSVSGASGSGYSHVTPQIFVPSGATSTDEPTVTSEPTMMTTAPITAGETTTSPVEPTTTPVDSVSLAASIIEASSLTDFCSSKLGYHALVTTVVVSTTATETDTSTITEGTLTSGLTETATATTVTKTITYADGMYGKRSVTETPAALANFEEGVLIQACGEKVSPATETSTTYTTSAETTTETEYTTVPETTVPATTQTDVVTNTQTVNSCEATAPGQMLTNPSFECYKVGWDVDYTGATLYWGPSGEATSELDASAQSYLDSIGNYSASGSAGASTDGSSQDAPENRRARRQDPAAAASAAPSGLSIPTGAGGQAYPHDDNLYTPDMPAYDGNTYVRLSPASINQDSAGFGQRISGLVGGQSYWIAYKYRVPSYALNNEFCRLAVYVAGYEAHGPSLPSLIDATDGWERAGGFFTLPADTPADDYVWLDFYCPPLYEKTKRQTQDDSQSGDASSASQGFAGFDGTGVDVPASVYQQPDAAFPLIDIDYIRMGVDDGGWAQYRGSVPSDDDSEAAFISADVANSPTLIAAKNSAGAGDQTSGQGAPQGAGQ